MLSIDEVVDRYDRQNLIEGWDQSVLDQSRLAIVGTDIAAHFAGLAATALGFGTIEIYGQGRVENAGFLFYQAEQGTQKAVALAAQLDRMNPLNEIHGLDIGFSYPGNTAVLGEPNAIIVAQNNPVQTYAIMEYGVQHSIPVITLATNDTYGAMGYQRNRMARHKRENLFFTEVEGDQGIETSQIMAAIAVEEARRAVMMLPGEQHLSQIDRKSVV